MRNIGLHMRLTTTLSAVIDRAIAQKSSVLQCFFITQEAMEYVSFAAGELESCRKKIQTSFKQAYLHASYWVNLAGMRRNGWKTFKKEVELAIALGFTHVVIHPGSATGCETREQGLEYLARALNRALEKYHDITIVIENTAHGNMSIGGSFNDFKALLALITEPDRLAFCVDTAHAYVYGYDITTIEGLENFITQIDVTIGLDKVILLHLNDSEKPLGSKIDKHETPGKGLIGLEALRRCFEHPRLAHTSVIVEAPALSDQQELDLLTMIRSWDTPL